MTALTDATRAQLAIGERRVGRRAVLAVAGEVDIQTASDLRAAIDAAGTRAFEIWVDLSDTTFMDSSGVHALAGARAQLARADRRLALICPAGPVRRVLELTGLDQRIEVHASLRAATRATTA
jgi:anti-anti-sigma factor